VHLPKVPRFIASDLMDQRSGNNIEYRIATLDTAEIQLMGESA
jgi:hypothetical protein